MENTRSTAAEVGGRGSPFCMHLPSRAKLYCDIPTTPTGQPPGIHLLQRPGKQVVHFWVHQYVWSRNSKDFRMSTSAAEGCISFTFIGLKSLTLLNALRTCCSSVSNLSLKYSTAGLMHSLAYCFHMLWVPSGSNRNTASVLGQYYTWRDALTVLITS